MDINKIMSKKEAFETAKNSQLHHKVSYYQATPHTQSYVMSTSLAATTCKNQNTKCCHLFFDSEMNFDTFPPGY